MMLRSSTKYPLHSRISVTYALAVYLTSSRDDAVAYGRRDYGSEREGNGTEAGTF